VSSSPFSVALLCVVTPAVINVTATGKPMRSLSLKNVKLAWRRLMPSFRDAGDREPETSAMCRVIFWRNSQLDQRMQGLDRGLAALDWNK
jgi:hypothetical protein